MKGWVFSRTAGAEAEPEASAFRADAGRRRAGVRQPDPWITAKIQAKYFTDDEVKGRYIDVDSQQDVVTLKGRVATEAEKRQAAALARNTEGVREVKDQLRVDGSLGERPAGGGPLPAVAEIDRPDPWITMKIQSKYFLDAECDGSRNRRRHPQRDCDVDRHGRGAALKADAEQIARDAQGVKRVLTS